MYGTATWDVTVERDTGRSVTLVMNYGNGHWESRTVMQGEGTVTFRFICPFITSGTWYQRATITQTGQYDTAETTGFSTTH